MKKKFPGWAVLLIITLVAGLALGATYSVTKDAIAQQAVTAAENARRAALPAADSFEQIEIEPASNVDWCYAGYQGDALIGYVAQITVQGFGGPIEVIAGLDTELTVTGISVGGSSFSETAGLGAKAKDAAFASQFVGKPAPVRVIKAGGTPADNTVDAITAATITSNAVAGAVNQIADFVEGLLFPQGRGDEIALPARPEAGVFSASARGYGGPVLVEAAFDTEGKITFISVGDENFAETPALGGLAREAEFLQQFIGKTAPVALGEIDAISGATLTTKAVTDALNRAYDASRGELPAETPAPALPERPETGIFSASSKGYAGPVWVEAAFDAEGKITFLSIGDDRFAETPALGGMVQEAEYISQFIGRQAPVDALDIDAVSGATLTSEAVVSAVNKAYNKYLADALATPAPSPAD